MGSAEYLLFQSKGFSQLLNRLFAFALASEEYADVVHASQRVGMSFGKHFRTTSQCFGEQRFSLFVVLKLHVDTPKVVERLHGVLVRLAKLGFPNLKDFREQRECFFRAVVPEVEVTKVVEVGKGVRVELAIHLAVQFDGGLVVQFRPLEISLGFIEKGKVVEQSKGAGVFRAEFGLCVRECLLEQRFGLIVKSLAFKELGQVVLEVDDVGGIAVVIAECILHDLESAPEVLFRECIVAQALVHAGKVIEISGDVRVSITEQLSVQLVHLPVQLKRLLQPSGVLVKLGEVAHRLNGQRVFLPNTDVNLRQDLREKCFCGFVLPKLAMDFREGFHGREGFVILCSQRLGLQGPELLEGVEGLVKLAP